jgi:hypothetical protein
VAAGDEDRHFRGGAELAQRQFTPTGLNWVWMSDAGYLSKAEEVLSGNGRRSDLYP